MIFFSSSKSFILGHFWVIFHRFLFDFSGFDIDLEGSNFDFFKDVDFCSKMDPSGPWRQGRLVQNMIKNDHKMIENDQERIENDQEMIENDQKSHGALIMGPKGALIIIIIIICVICLIILIIITLVIL